MEMELEERERERETKSNGFKAVAFEVQDCLQIALNAEHIISPFFADFLEESVSLLSTMRQKIF